MFEITYEEKKFSIITENTAECIPKENMNSPSRIAFYFSSNPTKTDSSISLWI